MTMGISPLILGDRSIKASFSHFFPHLYGEFPRGFTILYYRSSRPSHILGRKESLVLTFSLLTLLFVLGLAWLDLSLAAFGLNLHLWALGLYLHLD